MTSPEFLSSTEIAALEFLRYEGGSVLITRIPDKNEKDPVFRTMIPGLRVYQKLDKAGLVIITEEEPDETGFCWTPMVELTDAGKAALQ